MENKLELSDGIERSRDRIKKNGEVFTPFEIIEQMAQNCPEEDWKDPSKTFLDPTCGNGQILCYILQRRLASGVSPKDAISTLFGIELMKDNVKMTRKRLRDILNTSEYDDILEHNIVCSDIFMWDISKWCPRKERLVMKHKKTSLGGTNKVF
ncbi:MAG: N-6 DNA methylase [Methanobrevibacter sp.]|nr:N-6 DNA methylase [Methanobrevibacter sp.]